MIPPTVNEVTSALAGGTVGVMGTLLVLEVIRQRIEEMRQCPYCRGLRKLPCGLCYGMGFIPDARYYVVIVMEVDVTYLWNMKEHYFGKVKRSGIIHRLIFDIFQASYFLYNP
ncbi:hypothetical protein Gasu2_02780 [Galdieria sulphuraria]|nr:hypothetical protein Gasu2_02780 [Galdieria sulphuraria]